MNKGDERRIEQGSGFALVEDGGEKGGLFFVHDGGGRVRTDALGRAVWESLPGQRNEVLSRVRRRLAVPGPMAVDFLDVMTTAGIVGEAGGIRETARTETAEAQKRPEGLVSAVVVTHCGEAHIRACLSSLRNQTCREIEIILVDNASRDNTAEITAREFPDVRRVRMRKNLHHAAGVNRGVREARGEYLFILNDDTEVEPSCIENLRRRLAGDPGAAAAVPVMRFFDLRGFVNSVGNHIRGKGWGSDNFIGAVDLGLFDVPAETPSACFGAVLVRRADFEETGGLDVGFTAYYEDVDWSFRVRFQGRRIVTCGSAVVYHKFGGSAMPGPHKLRLVVRNRLRLVLKLFRGKMRTDYLISYVKEDAKTAASLAARKDWRGVLAYPRAYMSLLLSIPGILRKRASVMKRRDRDFDEASLPGNADAYPRLIDDEGYPVLDAGAYFRHYFWEYERLRAGAVMRGADETAERPAPGAREREPSPDGAGSAGTVRSPEEGRVAVIIVNWNTRDALAACLRAVERDGADVPIETLVVDNASTDGSADMVETDFPVVRLLRNRLNAGFAGGVNVAIRELMARSGIEHILLLNPDAVLRPGTLEALVRHMQNRPEAGACGPSLVLPNGRLQPGAGGFLPTARTAFEHFFLPSRRLRVLRPLFLRQDAWAGETTAVEVEWLSGACLMVRRRAVEQTGLLDERYFLYAEDIDWCARMAGRGWRIHYLPWAAAVHAHGLASGEFDVRWLRGLLDFTARTRGRFDFAAFRLFAVAGFLLRAARLAVIGPRGRDLPGGKAACLLRYAGTALTYRNQAKRVETPGVFGI